MANANAPMGFRPVRHRSGAPYTGAANPYYISNASNNTVFVGDPVLWTGTSNTALVEVVGGRFPIGTLPTVLRASAGAGNKITGVIVGLMPDPTALENKHRVNSTARVCWVCDDPDVIFEIQADSATDLGATAVGANFNFILDESGSTVTGLSGAELDGSDMGTEAQDQLIVMRAVNREDNDATLTHSKWEVMISNHSFIPPGADENEGVLGV